MTADALPVIDVSPLVTGEGDRRAVAAAIDAACREHGFFSIVHHGVDHVLLEDLERQARTFFAEGAAEKAKIAMPIAGACVGEVGFPVGGELTSGTPDRKEGIYFGAELGPDDPRVVAGIPLHGANLFPVHPAELRGTVLATIAVFTELGHQLMAGFALALGLDEDWFDREATRDPTVLFRIFHYPPLPPGEAEDPGWGVGEHTDYGLLTILVQDATGGLELRTGGEWVAVPARPGVLVCNLGDMLERMTGGQYRSTPHRARSPHGRGRISCPFFFDPGWDAEVQSVVEPSRAGDDASDRWDGVSVFDFDGTYGDYLLGKVAKVFPALRRSALE